MALAVLKTIEFRDLTAGGEGIVWKLKRYNDGTLRLFGEVNMLVDDTTAASKQIVCSGGSALSLLGINPGDTFVASDSATSAFNGTYTVVSVTDDDTDITFVVSEAVADDGIDDAVLTWDVEITTIRDPYTSILFVKLSEALGDNDGFEGVTDS